MVSDNRNGTNNSSNCSSSITPVQKSRGETPKIPPLLDFAKIIFKIVFLFMTVSCAANLSLYQNRTLNDEKKLLVSVPFIKQRTDYCGPATLAMIINFWGLNITQDEIAEEVYSSVLKGTLSIQMVLYAIKQGFEAEIYNGSLLDIKDKLTLGLPLIVSHRANTGDEIVHYLVILGFDDNKKVIYVHSGEKENQAIDYQTFLERWNLANNLTILVYPKEGRKPSAIWKQKI